MFEVNGFRIRFHEFCGQSFRGSEQYFEIFMFQGTSTGLKPHGPTACGKP